MSHIETLRKRIAHIDAVLITYADMQHLGALPYLVGKCGLSCPIYMTVRRVSKAKKALLFVLIQSIYHFLQVPVYKMGQMFLYDWYLSYNNVQEFEHFNLDDIDAVFERAQQLKYNQQVS